MNLLAYLLYGANYITKFKKFLTALLVLYDGNTFLPGIPPVLHQTADPVLIRGINQPHLITDTSGLPIKLSGFHGC